MGRLGLAAPNTRPSVRTGKKLKKLDELRSPRANSPTLCKSNKKGADLAIHPFLSVSRFSLAAFALRNHFVEFENR